MPPCTRYDAYYRSNKNDEENKRKDALKSQEHPDPINLFHDIEFLMAVFNGRVGVNLILATFFLSFLAPVLKS